MHDVADISPPGCCTSERFQTLVGHSTLKTELDLGGKGQRSCYSPQVEGQDLSLANLANRCVHEVV